MPRRCEHGRAWRLRKEAPPKLELERERNTKFVSPEVSNLSLLFCVSLLPPKHALVVFPLASHQMCKHAKRQCSAHATVYHYRSALRGTARSQKRNAFLKKNILPCCQTHVFFRGILFQTDATKGGKGGALSLFRTDATKGGGGTCPLSNRCHERRGSTCRPVGQLVPAEDAVQLVEGVHPLDLLALLVHHHQRLAAQPGGIHHGCRHLGAVQVQSRPGRPAGVALTRKMHGMSFRLAWITSDSSTEVTENSSSLGSTAARVKLPVGYALHEKSLAQRVSPSTSHKIKFPSQLSSNFFPNCASKSNSGRILKNLGLRLLSAHSVPLNYEVYFFPPYCA